MACDVRNVNEWNRTLDHDLAPVVHVAPPSHIHRKVRAGLRCFSEMRDVLQHGLFFFQNALFSVVDFDELLALSNLTLLSSSVLSSKDIPSSSPIRVARHLFMGPSSGLAASVPVLLQ